MKVSTLVASGGSGLITPAHTPAFSSLSPSILYITEWNPASLLSLSLFPPLLLPPVFLASENLQSPLCPSPTSTFVFHHPHPTPPFLEPPSPPCRLRENVTFSRDGAALIWKEGWSGMAERSLSLSPSLSPPLLFSQTGSHPTFLPMLHFWLFAPTQIFCLCVLMKFLHLFLDVVCVGLSVATCISPSETFALLLFIDPQEPCLIYGTWATDVIARNRFQAVSL